MDYKKKYEEVLEKNAILQKRYIENFNAKDENFSSLFNSTDSAFQVIAPIYNEDDKVVDYYYKNVNDNYLNKIGKTREEVINKRGTDIIGFHEDYWFETIEKVARTGNSIIYNNYSKSQNVDYELYAWKVNETDVAALLNDITEQKRNELVLQHSKEEIQKLNTSKERLVSIIAHDLRSPFNAILGFSNLLIENNNLEETLEYSKIIFEKAKETLVLLDNLLDFGNLNGKYVHFNPTKVLLSSVIGRAVKSYLPDAALKNISLVFNSEENLYVYVDETMLKSVTKNLISNALKFTESNGKVTVSIKQSNGICEVLVSDNGVGIPLEKQADLFNFKTNRTTRGTLDEKGTGLGLLICKEYLEKNNGTIQVESESGKGSTFTFTLPLIAS
tara:strand:- start:661 stop:1824 length:1164 start_codon:yes stop_codon:yes gene_type:complete